MIATLGEWTGVEPETGAPGKVSCDVGAPLLKRALTRLAFEEARRQRNIENVVIRAGVSLRGRASGESPGKPLDENWCTRFFSLAGSACSERVQEIWGRVLALELQTPRSFSFRTLDVLKNATADLIDALINAAQLRLAFGPLAVVIYPDTFGHLEREYGLTLRQILLLQEVGATIHDNNIRFVLPPSEGPRTDILLHGRKAMVLTREADLDAVSLPAILFTQVGEELTNLVEVRENRAYVDMVATLLRVSCARIHYADIQAMVGDQPLLENEEELWDGGDEWKPEGDAWQPEPEDAE